ncbi:hypothetical protein AAHA92_05903 [Salvia divinorum]|uniref:Uncharacterized protein n=1 Tax=Salvia divinorum TaxID=28513 RepID=A0ABD1I522_SALDI
MALHINQATYHNGHTRDGFGRLFLLATVHRSGRSLWKSLVTARIGFYFSWRKMISLTSLVWFRYDAFDDGLLAVKETDLHLDVKKNDEKAKKMQMQEDAVKNSPTVTGQNQEMVLPLFVRNVSWPDNPALVFSSHGP